jgi:Rieske Fe-S protein
MKRRAFFATGLALVAHGKRAWAQSVYPPTPTRYAALTTPVKIPVNAVAAPWQPVPFVAETTTGGGPAAPKREARRRVLINGVLFRTETDLSALCVTCPHEQCQVDLVTDAERLARMTGGNKGQPLFECGCHLSVFDAAAHGARVSGETPRGLYLFKIAGVRDGLVEITEIEEAALADV